jgi:hypothetical protein
MFGSVVPIAIAFDGKPCSGRTFNDHVDPVSNRAYLTMNAVAALQQSLHQIALKV